MTRASYSSFYDPDWDKDPNGLYMDQQGFWPVDAEMFALGRRLGFARLQLYKHLAVVEGESNWRIFCSPANQKEFANAKLKALEKIEEMNANK